MRVLGIETSCDETSVALVENGNNILAHVVRSQIDIHKQYGGVVPEVASRSHLEAMMPVVSACLEQAFGDPEINNKDSWQQIDAIAVTSGPGLSGGLLIGTLTARTLAILFDKPLYAVNHVLGHTYANFLVGTPEFPLLSLTASGGHTQLLLLTDYFEYKVLGQTQDDAVGEAFDKVAKMLGLEYPGGPSISRAALNGDKQKYKFPKARLANKYDFSFSGLKTAVLRKLQQEINQPVDFPSFQIADNLTDEQVADFAASFEYTAITTLTDKLEAAIDEYKPKTVVVGGGVAANKQLQSQLKSLNSDIQTLPSELCTDNAAMIASLGYFMAQKQQPISPKQLVINPSLSL